MILLRKAVRTIWRGKRSYLACVLLMGLGVMMYIALHLLYVNLGSARDDLYRRQRFADAFAQVAGLPLSTLDYLESLPGIETARGTLTADVRVEGLSSGEKIVTLRLNSYDPDETDRLNDFIVTQGASPGPGELLLGEPFFVANGFSPGDEITVVTGGERHVFTVSGAALSPEYVYAIPDSTQLMPDEQSFGFAYLPYREMGILTGKTGRANSLSFLLERGYTFEQLRPALEDALAPYGFKAAFARKDQPSNAMLTQEIDSLGAMATSISMVFIGMAVVILYIMLGRVIQQERMQIGTLKSFGFSSAALLFHYLSYGLVIGVFGGLLGVLGGLAMANGTTVIYLQFFHMPGVDAPFEPLYPVAGFLIAVACGVLGAFMGTRSVLRLLPSDAMRPPAPRVITRDALRSLGPIRHLLAGSGRMAVRNISRGKLRSLFVIVGVAFSFSLIAFIASYDSMFDAMMLDQFTKVQIYDLKAVLAAPKPYTAALEEAWRLEGVNRAEAVLEVVAELRHNHLKKNVGVTGLAEDSQLYKIYDNVTLKNHPPPKEGIILGRGLADSLSVGRGDVLTAKTPYTGGREIPLTVVDVIDGSIGAACYMELSALCRLLDLPLSANGVLFEAGELSGIKEKLLEAENVAALMDSDATRQIYIDMMQTYAVMINMMMLIGMAIAFAIISNSASISLAERSREYSTLRVLGMAPFEIGGIIAFEYRVLMVLGVLLGIPLVRLLKEAMADAINNDMFTIPTSTPLECYLLAAALCALTVEFCNLLAVRNISRFDMVEVLKERE